MNLFNDIIISTTIKKKDKTSMKYEFDNITTNELDKQTFNNFENGYDDNTLINKEPFTVELDTKDIELHVYIRHIDMREFTDDDNSQVVQLGVIPSLNSLSKENQDELLNQFMQDDRDYYMSNPNLLFDDIIGYGYIVELHCETTQDLNKVDYLIKSAMAVSPSVSGLIGFELDKIINRIGNTGWDYLSSYCENKDLIKTAINRYKSN